MRKRIRVNIFNINVQAIDELDSVADVQDGATLPPTHAARPPAAAVLEVQDHVVQALL